MTRTLQGALGILAANPIVAASYGYVSLAPGRIGSGPARRSRPARAGRA
jgi:hypothetical protein